VAKIVAVGGHAVRQVAGQELRVVLSYYSALS
jgi:hypothetical protein